MIPNTVPIFSKKNLSVLFLLSTLIACLYGKVFHHGFLTFDDQEFITQNPYILEGFTWRSFVWAWTNTDVSDWFPLTWLSILLDRHFFGMHAGWHHLVSVFYHILNAGLFFLFLRKATGSFWRAAAASFLFALHPLRVESVVWASERKDVLSLFFWMLTLLAYLWYVESKKRSAYYTSLGCFVCAAMSKAMVMTLPAVLLLLDLWPLKRLNRRNVFTLIVEKTPFWIVAFLTALLVLLPKISQKFMFTLEEFPLWVRAANAVIAYVRYLDKTFWPVNLAVFYPYYREPPSLWAVAGSASLLGLITWLAVRGLKKMPYIGMGWLWFLGTLFPVIGIFKCTNFIIADRYTYIPHLGFVWALVWGVSDFLTRRKISKVGMGAGALVLIAGLSWMTWRQIDYWKDDITLNVHDIEVTGDNDQAHNNLALYFEKKGLRKEAAHHYSESLRINPANLDVMNNAANLMMQSGNIKDALVWYSRILESNPGHRNARINLGLVLIQKGRFAEAKTHLEQALKVDPKAIKAYLGLADIAQAQKNPAAAWDFISAALSMNPRHEEANYIAANFKVAEQSYPEARNYYEKTLKANPGNFKASMNLANVHNLSGELELAVKYYKQALEIEPRFLLAHINLGKTYDKLGDGFSAVRAYEEALRLSPNNSQTEQLLEAAKKRVRESQNAWPITVKGSLK